MASKNGPPKKRVKPQILSLDHYDALDAALRRLADLPDIIDGAELCDIDCQEYRAAHKYFVEKLQRVKDKFFPTGRPPS